MKRSSLILLLFVLGIVATIAASKPNPDAGGIIISPNEGEISPADEITITFPVAMVSADKIDLAEQAVPFVSRPKMEGTFLWKSQTEGVFTVKELVAGATNRLTLAPGLVDADGKKLDVPDWSVDLTAAQFRITSDFDRRDQLPVQPQIVLDTTYPVRLSDVATHVYVQDRDSGQRLPVDVIVWQADKIPDQLDAREFRVSPRQPLPVGHTYDLIVNGLQDARSHQSLPYLKVIPLGTTVPLKVEWVGALNHALQEPSIAIKFNDHIDPEQATPENIRIEPRLTNTKFLAEGDQINVTGDFDISQRYRVLVSTSLIGERGFPLAEESHWGATFRSKEPCIAFPSSEIFLRARPDLQFSFFQINTPAVTWKLARVPLEKLAAVRARVREFDNNAVDPVSGKPIVDPRTGFNKPAPTELLVDAFKLPVVSSGSSDAAPGDSAVRRDIRCQFPSNEPPGGVYLLEATAALDGNRIVGNRSVICTSDFILTQKRTPESVFLRVAKMSDAQPVAGISVRAITKDNVELGRATTGKDGYAGFDRKTLFPDKKQAAHLFVAETHAGSAIQFVDGQQYYGASESGWPARTGHCEIITDRNLYRPGQVVKMKGLVRAFQGDQMTLPAASEVRWRVLQSDGDRTVAEAAAQLSSEGAWEAEWTVPEKSKLGRFEIRCAIGKEDCEGSASFSVQEYRVPLFSVTVEATTPQVGAMARAEVSSVYFHGAPNIGARIHWKASWRANAEFASDGDDYRKRFNAFAEVGPRIDPTDELTKTVEGDAILDRQGRATLNCESPFKDNAGVSRAEVYWRADVTSVDGQTISGGDHSRVFRNPVRLGIKTVEEFAAPRGVKASVDAVNEHDEKLPGVKVRLDLYLVTTKTAKEQIAPFVYRYRNVDQFRKIESRELTTPVEVSLATESAGRYVTAITALDREAGPVSDETTVSGAEAVELPVENETSFTIQHETRSFTPGEQATLSIQAPFGGIAWVSVETDKILDTMLVPLPGNAGRISLPIKKEYAPNATVSIYLVKPGGDRSLPRERFATSAIDVHRPDVELNIKARLASATVRPGEIVRGNVTVASDGKPVPGVDLLVFAVDDAVLKLGSWQLPNLIGGFYRRNPFAVRSYQSLQQFIEQITEKNLTQKGFIIGDGGEEATPNVTSIRKEFKTLAFWQGKMKTDSSGSVGFEFAAPDNLTTYRFVALGQTSTNQFGGDAETTVQVSKPLLINTNLPRFLRDRDEVELRVSVQQNFADSTEVAVRCLTDPGCRLSGPDMETRPVQRDTPTVYRFKAHVQDQELTPCKIRFEAVANANPAMNDAVELTIPVQPPTIIRKESLTGSFTGPALNVQSVLPQNWKSGRGKFDAIVSTSPWLAKMAGIPEILEYPHGCFEQISTKLLGYSFLAALLAYLPDVGARDAEYRAVLERGMKQFKESLLEDGSLPYWPGGTSPHPFVTCQAFWAVNESVNAGFQAPEGLQDKLGGALKKIVNGESGASVFDRCFALFVLSQYQTDDDLRPISQDLYLRRNQGNDESRAFLAIALHRQGIMGRETEQLLREIDPPPKERAFDPRTFTSTTRAEAIVALAFDNVGPKTWTAERRKIRRDRIVGLMDSSAALSTQENLWLLLAFKSMVDTEGSGRVGALQPPNAILSKNESSAAWLDRNLSDELSLTGLTKAAMTFLVRAEYSTAEINTDRLDRGLRVERVVHNVTDPKRTGDTVAPFKIGDQLLVTYRITSRKKQNYVALEDDLPAGLEVVNPNLAMIGKFFELPANDSPNGHVLALSYSEMRDRATLLYFDNFEPGTGTYSVLARASAAGTFCWPATQVAPMYDTRFSGLSPSSVCVIAGE